MGNGIEVVWLDGTTTVWPTAVRWAAYRAGTTGKEAAFTGDLALLDGSDEPVSIVGAGTFRWIGLEGAAQIATAQIAYAPSADEDEADL